MSLNCALKIVNFLLYVLYNNKRIKGEGRTLSEVGSKQEPSC